MTKKTDEWMPLHVRDYIADTQHLSTEEHGAYLLLIFAYWLSQEPLDDDDKRLSRVVRCNEKTWRKSLRPGISKLFQIDGGKWRHKRIDEELAKAKAISEARSAASRTANGIRHGVPKASVTELKRSSNGAKSDTVTAPPTTKNKEQRTTTPVTPPPAGEGTPVSQVCEAMGVRLSDDPYRLGWAKILHEMMRDGLDLHADIIPAAIEARKRSVANLTWVRRAAEAGKAKRGVKASQASAPPAFERTDDRGWTKRCMVWFGLMDEADKPWLWTPKWGPKPDEDGFLAPPEIFAKVAAAARKVRPELFSQETAH